MRKRLSARVLPVDEAGRVLLVRFVFKDGVLAGQDYWATVGGALNEGETFAEAARRELFEETGYAVEDVGTSLGTREFELQLMSGEKVLAVEEYFKVRVAAQEISRENFTDLEHKFMTEYRWWSVEELRAASVVIYPENLLEMLGEEGRNSQRSFAFAQDDGIQNKAVLGITF